MATLLDLPVRDIPTASKRPIYVKASSMARYRENQELSLTHLELARRFKVSQPAISAAVRKGRQIVKEYKYVL